jgi:glycosyltransferase involved in cell wall biosynthesis
VVIHHGSAAGIDLERFNVNLIEYTDIRKDLGISPTDFVFIFVGRIVKDKGVNELVNVFVKLQALKHSVHLILVGPEEEGLNPISDESHKHIETNKNIHALGQQDDIRPYLLSSNAFVLPSYREGFGMVLIEAGALGLPCITTDISGCNEIIIPGENGEIIPVHNENALYYKMNEWVEQPEKIAYMAAQSRSLVENRFERGVVWNALLEEYRRLLD